MEAIFFLMPQKILCETIWLFILFCFQEKRNKLQTWNRVKNTYDIYIIYNYDVTRKCSYIRIRLINVTAWFYSDGRLETIITHSCQKKHMTVTQPANTQQTCLVFKWKRPCKKTWMFLIWFRPRGRGLLRLLWLKWA